MRHGWHIPHAYNPREKHSYDNSHLTTRNTNLSVHLVHLVLLSSPFHSPPFLTLHAHHPTTHSVKVNTSVDARGGATPDETSTTTLSQRTFLVLPNAAHLAIQHPHTHTQYPIALFPPLLPICSTEPGFSSATRPSSLTCGGGSPRSHASRCSATYAMFASVRGNGVMGRKRPSALLPCPPAAALVRGTEACRKMMSPALSLGRETLAPVRCGKEGVELGG
jgi:hypothetical protein